MFGQWRRYQILIYCVAALLRIDIEKYMIKQVSIELFQPMMRTVRIGFIAIGSDIHAVTACAGFRRDRKGKIQTAHANVAANVAVANVALVGRGRLRCCCITGGLRGHFRRLLQRIWCVGRHA